MKLVSRKYGHFRGKIQNYILDEEEFTQLGEKSEVSFLLVRQKKVTEVELFAEEMTLLGKASIVGQKTKLFPSSPQAMESN